MSGARIHFLLLALFTLASGCASSPETAPASLPDVSLTEPEFPENPAILQAEDDLQHARIQGAEWMVIESSMGNIPVSLAAILARAQEHQQNGNQADATRLAQKVSTFARLGIDQALQQANAKPFYPQ